MGHLPFTFRQNIFGSLFASMNSRDTGDERSTDRQSHGLASSFYFLATSSYIKNASLAKSDVNIVGLNTGIILQKRTLSLASSICSNIAAKYESLYGLFNQNICNISDFTLPLSMSLFSWPFVKQAKYVDNTISIVRGYSSSIWESFTGRLLTYLRKPE